MLRIRRWSWIVVLVVGLALFEAVRRALLHTGNPNLVPSLILLGAAVAPASFVTFVAARRLDFSVTGGVVALTALVGGVIGVVTAGTLEFDTLHRLGMLPMFGVALIEESAKLIAPAGLLLVIRHRHAADGLLLGVASGAGFAALETMGYAFVTLVQSRGDLAAVDSVLILRGVLSPAAHMAWTGLAAAALWQVFTRQAGPGRFLLAFGTAVVLHTVWDSVGLFLGYLVLAVVSLAMLTRTTHRLAVQSGRSGPDQAQRSAIPT